MTRRDRVDLLKRLLDERVLVIDGAMGTALQDLQLSAADFGGPDLEGCNENLNLTRPDVVRGVHRGYLEAGADILETNTFGGTPIVLAEYGLQDKAVEINREAARLAREEADKLTDKPRFVAGSMGPTTKAISVTGGSTTSGGPIAIPGAAPMPTRCAVTARRAPTRRASRARPAPRRRLHLRRRS